MHAVEAEECDCKAGRCLGSSSLDLCFVFVPGQASLDQVGLGWIRLE